MILVQLKYAIAVVGQNSLNEAAKMLFISQPKVKKISAYPCSITHLRSMRLWSW